jgi:hypothetical protein
MFNVKMSIVRLTIFFISVNEIINSIKYLGILFLIENSSTSLSFYRHPNINLPLSSFFN